MSLSEAMLELADEIEADPRSDKDAGGMVAPLLRSYARTIRAAASCRERDKLRTEVVGLKIVEVCLTARCKHLESQVAALRAALEPFVAWGKAYQESIEEDFPDEELTAKQKAMDGTVAVVTVGDCRRAAKLLEDTADE